MKSKAELNLAAFLPYRLSIASNTVSRLIATIYIKRFGLSNHEWRLMAVLFEMKTATQQGLTRRTQMDKIAVSRAARALSRHGLVKRVPSKKDGRALEITLSAAGLARYHQIAPEALALESQLLDAFTAREIEGLGDMLARLTWRASALLGEDTQTATRLRK